MEQNKVTYAGENQYDQKYYMEHGILVTYGRQVSCQMAVFHPPCMSARDITFKGLVLNTNSVSPFPVVNSFKEISEIIDGYERTNSFSPSFMAQQLDNLNWAGFCYLETQRERLKTIGVLPVIIFTDTDKYIESDGWKEISTQQAIEMINQYTIPKKEEEDAA